MMFVRVQCEGVSMVNTIVQSQKAVTACFSSKQLLPFGFAEQNNPTHNEHDESFSENNASWLSNL